VNTLNTFDYDPVSRVIFGNNTIQRLGEVVSEMGFKRALLVTDSGIVSAGYAQQAADSLKKHSIHCVIFDEVEENPSSFHVDQGVRFAKKHLPIDVIIGLGGGSAMDSAKGINFILTNGGKMEDYWGANKARHPLLPSIGIPTTAGTGSEAQSYALISHHETKAKMACGDKKARFQVVILDPVLTVTKPRSVTAISGIDAVTHAVESYVATTANPLSRMFSAEAWRLLNSNLEVVLNQPENLEARAKMQLGSYFAGMAIEFSMLGAAHACANPLTTHYNVMHGVAVGLMLPHVIQFNAPVAESYYQELMSISGMPGNSEHLHNRIIELQRVASLPNGLRACNVQKSRIPELAKDAAMQWTGKFNPRQLTEKEFIHLYESAF
jgi:alcohol dehydrogenase